MAVNDVCICMDLMCHGFSTSDYTAQSDFCLRAHRYAAAVQDGSQYFVLLIITDGVISDMAQTKEAIVNVRTRGR